MQVVTHRSLILKKSTILMFLVVFISSLATSLAIQTPRQADALSGSQFNPGRIIDDSVFYNKNAMTAAQIQSFLNSKMPDCDTDGSKSYSYYYRASPLRLNDSRDTWVTTTRAVYGQRVYQRDGNSWRGSRAPYTCLKDYRQTTVNIAPESGLCNGYTGASNEPAAQIIYKASQSCGVNPQVMLVTLQKEQSLITDDWPWGLQFKKATGVDCPDNPPSSWAPYNCDPESLGFFKQMYYGAHRFKWYKANATNYQYRAGRNNTILWHPNSGCGTSNVYIQNQATAALYIYTPYRPNQAALNNLYGEGNSCSSYGNRNFWRMFNDWFGSTLTSERIRFILCDGQRYSVESGAYKRRLMTDTAVAAWGLSGGDFSSTGYGCELPIFSEQAGRLLRSRTTGDMYLIDKAIAYKVSSQATANSWGLGDLNQTLPQFDGASIHEELSVRSILPRFVKSDNSSVTRQYIIDDAKRYVIAGSEDSNQSPSIELVKGYDQTSYGVFSTTLLSSLPQQVQQIDYAFQVGSDWYLLDHGKIRKISSEAVAHWTSFITGPTLTESALSIFPQLTIDTYFERDGGYYRVVSNGDIEKTYHSYITKDWGVDSPPTITRLLTSKILPLTQVNDVSGVVGNIRLVSCNNTRYLVERGIRRRRPVTPEGLAAWGFENKYFLQNDTVACSYPAFAISADQLVRSRNTNKVYYVNEGKAYYVHSLSAAQTWGFGDINSQTYPMFDGQSIKDNLQILSQLP